jgi:hypothetical protein
MIYPIADSDFPVIRPNVMSEKKDPIAAQRWGEIASRQCRSPGDYFLVDLSALAF